MHENEHKLMERAIRLARRCSPEDGRPHPKVGVVVARDDQIVATAFRGERGRGDHAEFIALEKKLKRRILAGTTVYTTLEPCTTRNHPKISCVQRLIERRVRRVVVGMLDPNPTISGKGLLRLRDAGVTIDLFPPDLMATIEELNRDFRRAYPIRSVRNSGISQYTENCILEVPWEEYLRQTAQFEMWVAYSTGIIRPNRSAFEKLLQKRKRQIRVFLPDWQNTEVVEHLARKFYTSATTLSNRIKQAISEYASIFGAGAIRLAKKEPPYSVYLFDPAVVLSMQSVRPRKPPLPTFIGDRGGDLYKYFRAELKFLRKKGISRPLTPREENMIATSS